MSQKVNPNISQKVNPAVNPRQKVAPRNDHNIEGVGVHKNYGHYGNADVGTANALYNKYKKWFKANKPADMAPMPFKEWLKWAQDKGMCNNFAADGENVNVDYDFDEFSNEIKALNSDSLRGIASEMKTAQAQNWGGDNLLGLHGLTGTFGITNQPTLKKASELVDAEIKSREDVKKVDVKSGIGRKIGIAIGVAILAGLIIAGIASSGKKK